MMPVCPLIKMNCVGDDCAWWCKEICACTVGVIGIRLCEKTPVTTCKMCINYISARKKTTGEICGVCAKLHPTLDSQDVVHECEDYNERGI